LDLKLVVWPHAKFVGRLGNRRNGRKLDVVKINLAKISEAFFEGKACGEWEDFLIEEIIVTHLHELVHWASGLGCSDKSHDSWDDYLYKLV
jgi:hypothetical protein